MTAVFYAMMCIVLCYCCVVGCCVLCCVVLVVVFDVCCPPTNGILTAAKHLFYSPRQYTFSAPKLAAATETKTSFSGRSAVQRAISGAPRKARPLRERDSLIQRSAVCCCREPHISARQLSPAARQRQPHSTRSSCIATKATRMGSTRTKGLGESILANPA
jgi:hypothetical protein